MRDPLEVASTRDVWWIDKAGEKGGRSRGEGSFLPPCCTELPVREGSTDGTGLEKRVRSSIFIVLLRPLTILVPLQVLKIIISHSFFMWRSSSGLLLL